MVAAPGLAVSYYSSTANFNTIK